MSDDRITGETPILFRMPIALRWRDLDAFNHVNNSKYLSYLEEARLRQAEHMLVEGERLFTI